MSKAFPSSPTALSNVTVDLSARDITVIIGANGSGKSTLLNCIAGLLPFENGIIDVGTQAVTYKLDTSNQRQINIQTRKHIGYIFQQKVLWNHFTILENIVHPLMKVHGFDKDKAYNRAKKYFDCLQLEETHYKKYPNQLSGGQQRKVAIARTLAIEPDLLLIDELEANLDQSALKLALDIIEENFVNKGKTVLIVSHSIDLLERLTPNILLLHEGGVAEKTEDIGELLSKQNNTEMTKIIKKSVDSSSRRWFIANQSLETAIEISRININEKDINKLLTEVGKRISELITKFDPDNQHLLMIATKFKNGSPTPDVKIRCAEKTDEFILDGDEVPKLNGIVTNPSVRDGKAIYDFKQNYKEYLQNVAGIKLGKESFHPEGHNSLIDMMFDSNGKELFYQFSDRHPKIDGAYNIIVPIPEGRSLEKDSYYEFSKNTRNVYLIGCVVDNEVKGIISIDTYSKEKWTNFKVQQLILIGNMVAIAIKNHE